MPTPRPKVKVPKSVWVDLLEGTAWIKNFPHLKRRRKHGRIIPKYVLPSTLSKLERAVVKAAMKESGIAHYDLDDIRKNPKEYAPLEVACARVLLARRQKKGHLK